MARPKATQVDEQDKETENELPSAEIAEEIEKQKAIEEWLGEFQSRFTDQPVRVLVEKFEDGEWSICRKYALGSFDHESVREEFGGGRFRATLFDPSGKYIKGGRNNFKFANPSQSKEPQQRQTSALADPAVALIMQQMKSQADNMMGLVQAMIAAQSSKSSGGIGELVEAMKGLRSLTPNESKPIDSLKDLLTVQKLFKEVNDDGADRGGGWLADVKEFLTMAPMLKEALPALRAGLPATSNPLAAEPKPPLPSQPNGGQPEVNAVSQRIIALVPAFVAAAKINAPISQWSDNLLDNLENMMPALVEQMRARYGPLIKNDDDVYDMLIRYAEDGQTREQIYVAIPPLAPYKQWCDQVIAQAVKDLTDDANGANVVTEAIGGNKNGATPPNA